MSLLFRILYAAHASGTHHKLALDALADIGGPMADAWRRLFLAHAEIYMIGAKAPDNEFKDFKNHVLHVRDGYWGGAAGETERWYDTFVAELKAGRWPEAVRAAGILSHYFTDPIHPFHTGQSEAENNMHRAVEWSISRSYDTLRAIGLAAARDEGPMPGFEAGWLRAFVAAGADVANRHYEPLMAHYDLDRGVSDPPSGLDTVGRTLVGGLIVYAGRGFARVLERALAEAAVAPPVVDLTIETVLAALKIPSKLLVKRLDNAADRREVERMYDELKATGRVEATLGEAERTVRDLHAAEVLSAQLAQRAEARAAFIGGGRVARAPTAQTEAASVAVAQETLPPRPMEALSGLSERRRTMQQPSHLAPGDDVERAPSIGPKMAERLAALGIRTVADLLAAEPTAVAGGLALRQVDGATIEAWQHQARLVTEPLGLRGTQAQLLVGAGFRSAAEIAATEADVLCARVLAYAATAEGRRVLRDGGPPDIATIRQWGDLARGAKVA